MAAAASFTEALDAKSLEAFSVACKKPFGEQAQFFLNAFWDESNDQAECIYSVAFELIKSADMRCRNITYVHMYEEGADLDFDMGLYFFEKLNKFYAEEAGSTPPVIQGLNGSQWVNKYPKSVPEEQTAVVRKKELRDKVDVNFDGRVSFLEFLLYQYKASPKDLMDRQAPSGVGIPPEVLAAMAALQEVNKRVREYETEKTRLEEAGASGSGIKALKAKNELAQLLSGPLWEQINKALITAEAALRIAQRKYGAGGVAVDGAPRISGTMWWLDRELRTKKERYGPRAK